MDDLVVWASKPLEEGLLVWASKQGVVSLLVWASKSLMAGLTSLQPQNWGVADWRTCSGISKLASR
jgi:hypothetical protein